MLSYQWKPAWAGFLHTVQQFTPLLCQVQPNVVPVLSRLFSPPDSRMLFPSPAACQALLRLPEENQLRVNVSSEHTHQNPYALQAKPFCCVLTGINMKHLLSVLVISYLLRSQTLRAL